LPNIENSRFSLPNKILIGLEVVNPRLHKKGLEFFLCEAKTFVTFYITCETKTAVQMKFNKNLVIPLALKDHSPPVVTSMPGICHFKQILTTSYQIPPFKISNTNLKVKCGHWIITFDEILSSEKVHALKKIVKMKITSQVENQILILLK